MSVIEQQREYIISENNSAQTRLLAILENYSRQETTLRIEESLHGNLDLSPLSELGFGLINSIIFSKGEITNIEKIPKGISSLICTDNLILSLDNLPSSLLNINVSENIINNIDVSNLNKLQTLYISHNKLQHIENLPASLVEFVADFNQLQHLNLV